jgi:hypothetical protein
MSRINGAKKMVVKKAIRESAEHHDGDVRPGTEAYADLMQNVEHQVQAVLEECGEIER